METDAMDATGAVRPSDVAEPNDDAEFEFGDFDGRKILDLLRLKRLADRGIALTTKTLAKAKRPPVSAVVGAAAKVASGLTAASSDQSAAGEAHLLSAGPGRRLFAERKRSLETKPVVR